MTIGMICLLTEKPAVEEAERAVSAVTNTVDGAVITLKSTVKFWNLFLNGALAERQRFVSLNAGSSGNGYAGGKLFPAAS